MAEQRVSLEQGEEQKIREREVGWRLTIKGLRTMPRSHAIVIAMEIQGVDPRKWHPAAGVGG